MIRAHADGSVIVDVLVTPRAAKSKIGEVHDGRLKVYVTSAPTDGEANRAVEAVLAKWLGLPGRAVAVHKGTTSRRKSVVVIGTSVAEIMQRLAPNSG